MAHRHIIKLPNGKKYYLQVIIDNCSRLVLSWAINITKEAINTVHLLKQAKQFKEKNTMLMMDKGTENTSGIVQSQLNNFHITKILAKKDTHFSNSMVEAFFRSLKSNFLYHSKPNSLTRLMADLEFYVEQFNFVIPHSAHYGLTPHERYTNRDSKKIKMDIDNFSIRSKKIRYNSFWKMAV